MVFIPPPNNQVAGPQTFLRNLSEYLKKINYSFTSNLTKADAILASPTYPLEQVKNLKNRGGKVIQRLDGVYYPEKHNDVYQSLNVDTEEIYKNYADFVIFQSEYSKAQVFQMFGELPEEKYKIVINGVNKKIFFPEKPAPHRHKYIKLITTGNFRNVEMLEPIVQALDKLKNQYNFELNIVGPLTNPDLMRFTDRSYINFHGSKTILEVAKLLRSSDIFIYSHLNPPCPNSVIEAISTGLPVVGFDSGSMSELLFFSQDLLAKASNEVFQKYDDFNYEKLKEKIELVINEFDKYKKKAMDHSNLYSFEQCGAEYVKVFEEFKSNSNLISKLRNLLWPVH